ncbi:hypothetical protein TNCV_1861621 [Trichonephila clavipes]|nr:hypothetical protein TNCV_1861621 [Trichonephila clavipes]
MKILVTSLSSSRFSELIVRSKNSRTAAAADDESKTPIETLEVLSKAYGESTIAKSKVCDWHRRFKEGRLSIEDD